MKTIWKTVLEATDEQEIEVPSGTEFLTAREQMEAICLWFRCDPDQPRGRRRIAIRGTGHNTPDPEEARYLGTAFLMGGQLVFHVFERT